ncbi:hypothetical protein EST38_g12415 [Candolleomyces aberdarensis]|uniref:Uncharacterized protein n=1 Tax=Candolleomyces aberdarensis TaxID=2316362 RepID=A0A4Q2D2H7_9AGAR|nr:hypothetical protein EST38_g12415 [Candolleomyces aberdarensis]
MLALLTTQFSLKEFVTYMQDLLTSNQLAKFIKFALTGQPPQASGSTNHLAGWAIGSDFFAFRLSLLLSGGV